MFAILGLLLGSMTAHAADGLPQDNPPITLPVESYSTSSATTPLDICQYNGKSSWQPDPANATGSCNSEEDLQALISKNKLKWAKDGLASFCKVRTRLPASVNSQTYHQSRVRQARCSPTKQVEYELMCNACKSVQK